MSERGEQVVAGISISASGQATIDRAIVDVLFELAVQLERPTQCPVDVEHVLGAVVMAARAGELDRDQQISASDPTLLNILTRHVKRIFDDYNGQVGNEV